jgi:hypothetical protein
MQEVVKKKLKLSADADVKLSWMHDGESIRLDDGAPTFLVPFGSTLMVTLEDDFPGLSVYAQSVVSVVVHVAVTGAGSDNSLVPDPMLESQVERDQPPPKKRKKVDFLVKTIPQNAPTSSLDASPHSNDSFKPTETPTISKKRSKKGLSAPVAVVVHTSPYLIHIPY